MLIGSVSAAYAFKRYCDQKNNVKYKKEENSIKNKLWLNKLAFIWHQWF